MHTLYNINKAFYTKNIEEIVQKASQTHNRTCYISFNDPFNVVVNFLEQVKDIDHSKFIVIDASNQKNEKKVINKTTYTIPTNELFRVYMLLRELITDHGVDLLIMDSLSALIRRFSDFPLKRMITDLYMEVGGYRCNTSSIIFEEHTEHELVNSIRPLIGKNVRM